MLMQWVIFINSLSLEIFDLIDEIHYSVEHLRVDTCK